MQQYINPKLKPFFETIKPIGDKNHGGCLFFAYAFWLWCKEEELPLNTFRIIQIDCNRGHDLETNINWIDNREGYLRSSHHFTWKYYRTEYDAEGQYNHNKYKNYDGKEALEGLHGQVCLVEEFCVKALKEGGWNWMFNREEAIELCENELGIDLSKLKYKKPFDNDSI